MEVRVLGKQVLSAFLAFAVAIGLLRAFSITKYLALDTGTWGPQTLKGIKMQERIWGLV